MHFYEHALALGVPAKAMLLEPNAANTGQNIAYAPGATGVQPRSVMLVIKPYMERRTQHAAIEYLKLGFAVP